MMMVMNPLKRRMWEHFQFLLRHLLLPSRPRHPRIYMYASFFSPLLKHGHHHDQQDYKKTKENNLDSIQACPRNITVQAHSTCFSLQAAGAAVKEQSGTTHTEILHLHCYLLLCRLMKCAF